MGDALMQVLDIAEKIQAGDAAAATSRPRSPRPRARPPRPGADAAPTPRRPPIDQPSGEPLVAAILLSDGANSVGEAEPLDAADRAATLGVPIYTIALGTPDGKVDGPRPVRPADDARGPAGHRDAREDRRDHRRASRSMRRPPSDLQAVYDNLQSRVGYTEETQEVTALFAGRP